jgi:hypothetical protein
MMTSTFRSACASKTLILGVLSSLMALSSSNLAAAQSADEANKTTLDSVFECAAIEAEMDRLACYDTAVGRLKTANDSGDLVTITRQQVEDVEKDAFGFSLSSLPRLFSRAQSQITGGETDDLTDPVNSGQEAGQAVDKKKQIQKEEETYRVNTIEQPLRRVVEFSYEKNRFYLENGQVWDQTSSEKLRIPRERDGKRNFVEIRRGALGSFLLRVNGTGKAVPVERRR